MTAQQTLKQIDCIMANSETIKDQNINALFAELKQKLERAVMSEKTKKMKQSDISSYFNKV